MSTPNELDLALNESEDEFGEKPSARQQRARRRVRKESAPYTIPANPVGVQAATAATAKAAAATVEPKANADGAQTRSSEQPDEKKYTDHEPENRSLLGRIVAFFTDDRMRLFLAAVLMIGSLYMLYAMVSYFRTAAHDQSVVENTSLAEIAAEPDMVENAAGGLGAWLSDLLMCKWLGIGSAVFIIYFWILALALLKVRKCKFWSVTFKTLLVAITASVVLGFVFFNTGTVVRWGGNHGHYVNALVISYATEFGALLLSLLLLVTVIAVYLHDLRRVWGKWQQVRYNNKLRNHLAAERLKKAENLEDPAQEHSEISESSELSEHSDSLEISEHSETSEISEHSEISETSEHSEISETSESDDIGFYIDLDPDSDSDPDRDIEGEMRFANPYPDNTEEMPDILPVDENPQEIFTVTEGEIEAAKNPNKIDRGLDQKEPYDHRAELSRFKFPDVKLLKDHGERKEIDMDEQEANKDRIIKTLATYKIEISSIEATVGPTVTRYEIVPAPGVKVATIKNLEDDIAMSLAARGIRIIAPIPGKGTIGIEVPNADPQIVSMKTVITSKKFQECKMELPMALGATIDNDIFIADLADCPHLLVAGATGMGKSVGLNAIITSLLYKKHPSELKIVLVDPKMVEFSLYSKLEQHYLAKLPDEEDAILTDSTKVILTLKSLEQEMDDRFLLLKNAGVREVKEYNKKFTDRRLNPEKGHRYLPYLVVIIDEFADLIMMAGKDIETPICRIAQKGRAAGMHMIIATQRPSTNVITGLIRSQFPARMAFRVASMMDSRTILDRPGANQLIGRGDMLFLHKNGMDRVQCAFVSTTEVEEITEWIGNQAGFPQAYALPMPQEEGGIGEAMPSAGASMERDNLFDEAARFIVSKNSGSTSLLQRQFGVGYNRAGRLMDSMEAAGIVGPINGAKPRLVLVDMAQLEQILSQRR